jgi:hypothetical protein
MLSRARQLVVLGVVASLGWGVPSALAAAPSNDTAAGATVIGTIPFGTTIDTSDATTDADDAALNEHCGAPATNGSVWFTWTAPAGVDGLQVDVSASSFSAGALIAEPDGVGGWLVDACGPGVTGTQVVEGVTYRILAFSDTPGVTGGQLSIQVAPAAVPTLSLTVNPRGKVDRYGNALLSGSYVCADGDGVWLDAFLKQPVGRFAVSGYGSSNDELLCDGVSRAWSAVVVPDNGKFAGGKAATFTFAFTCGSVFCAETYTEQLVRLSR